MWGPAAEQLHAGHWPDSALAPLVWSLAAARANEQLRRYAPHSLYAVSSEGAVYAAGVHVRVRASGCCVPAAVCRVCVRASMRVPCALQVCRCACMDPCLHEGAVCAAELSTAGEVVGRVYDPSSESCWEVLRPTPSSAPERSPTTLSSTTLLSTTLSPTTLSSTQLDPHPTLSSPPPRS